MSELPSIALNGHTVFVRKIEPFKSVVTLARLQKSFVGPLVGAMTAGENPDPVKQAEIMVNSVEKLSANMTPAEVKLLLEVLIDPTYLSIRPSGKDDAVKLDEGKINLYLEAEHLIDLVHFVVETNWKGFFARIKTLIIEARERKQNQMVADHAALVASSGATST